MRRFRLHGLTIDSEPALAVAGRQLPGSPDLVVTQTRGPTSEAPPPASGDARASEVLSIDRDAQGDIRHVLSADSTGYRLHVPSVFDLTLDSEVRTAWLATPQQPRADPAIVLTGLGLACALTVRGHPLLHASAVEWEDHAIAVVAPGGEGKSTLAALLCAAGARLVTDDTLRFQSASDRTWVWRGTDGIRLRQNVVSRELTAHAADVVPAADGRLGLAPEMTPEDRLPLGCLVMPIPDPTASEVSAKRLSAGDALVAILRAGRLPGWLHGTLEGPRFQAAAELSAAVPVLATRVPWRPGSATLAGPALLSACAEEFT